MLRIALRLKLWFLTVCVQTTYHAWIQNIAAFLRYDIISVLFYFRRYVFNVLQLSQALSALCLQILVI